MIDGTELGFEPALHPRSALFDRRATWQAALISRPGDVWEADRCHWFAFSCDITPAAWSVQLIATGG